MVWLRRLLQSIRPRHLIVAGFVTGWAFIMAAGAGREPDSTQWVGTPSILNLLLVLFGASTIFTVTIIIYVLVTGEAGSLEAPERKPMWPALLLLLVLLALASRFGRFDREDEAETAVPDSPEPVDPDPGLGVTASLTGTELFALLTVVATAVGLMLWSRRRSTAFMPEVDPSGAEVAPNGVDGVVARAVDHLRLGHDPRSAVLEAYVELEQGLAAEGLARHSAETAAEHVRRALRTVTVDHQAVDNLSALYEQARFSDLPVTASDQQSAVEALRLVRSGLGVPR